MPQDLPGFYFDAEKNRYFPIKGPIPGSSRNSSSASTSYSSTTAPKSLSKSNLVNKPCRRIGIKTAKLLRVRELHGKVITSSKGKCNFQEEYQKTHASKPMIWKYHGTKSIGDGALEQIHVNIGMPHGLIGTDILLAGSASGYLSLCEVGKVGQQFDYGDKFMPDCVWPLNTRKREVCVEVPVHLWRPPGASMLMSSNISCIKMCGKHSNTESSSMQHVLITTLGSETSGGSVNVLNLSDPLDYDLPVLERRASKVTSFNCTVWTADCSSDGSQAVVGTDLGAALVNLETGVQSWVFRCKSDVLSLQLDHSGRIVLCGLRNGAIVTVDTRQKSEEFSARLTRHRIPYPSRGTCKPSSRITQNFTKQWFELKGNILHSDIVYMPSSISCLASLQLYDRYFLSSSMDGSIRLYDHRLIRRGPLQSYEGNMNSHTRIQLGVDPYERFFMSGGEDCNLRLWSIKSGELLFEDNFMDSVPSIVCWPKELPRVHDEMQNQREVYSQDYSQGAWLGSQEGLFYMCWP
ncbi:DDB1- and CUL4-associated factor 4 isoform X1 [Camellia sinensis]|uniref:DDB1- and CUL4-associated factor 4 isoform X1 n=1 Tax=Camellia sinensis TaxID=4442 RepID=UPI0010360A57|nr:DDB1- and CUL4-associated factor 4 isoform X1 [Camellia sinensis]